MFGVPMSLCDDSSVTLALAAACAAPPAERARVECEAVAHLLPMARRLAGQYAHRGVEVDDLEQVAALALVTSLRRFDPAAGQLRAFVATCVLGEVKRHFRDCSWTVRPPRHVQDLQSEVVDAMCAADPEIEPQAPDRPRRARVAEALGIDEATVTEVLAARSNFRSLSLDRAAADGGPAMEARLAAPVDDFDACDRRSMVRSLCAVLPDDDCELLRLRFVDELSQREIAERTGATQKQVSRALERVLGVLRKRAALDAA
jgi:RNA polymerase sigma-B factor